MFVKTVKSFIFIAFLAIILFPISCIRKNTSATNNKVDETEPIYYVSPNGNDQHASDHQSPWRSPAYASRQLSPGDTLIILAGRYILQEYDSDILMPPPGTEGNWITIKGEENNRPILVGRDNLSHAISLSSYLVLENLEITSDNGSSFRDALAQIDRPVSNIIIRGLYIHHIDEFGVNIADVSQLTISSCSISYTGFGSIGGPGGQQGGWQNVLMEECQLNFNGHYYQGGPGPGPYDRPDGFGIEFSTGPVEIKNSIARHNRGDGFDSKARNTYIHHCIAANNTCDGIKLWSGDSRIENCLIYGTGDGRSGSSPWAGLVIEGNSDGDTFEITNITIHDNLSRQAYPLYIGYDQGADIHVNMRNCIIANSYGASYFGPRVTLTIEYNLFFRPGDEIQIIANGRDYSVASIRDGVLGTGNIVADPLFVNPAWGGTGDYHLQENSPAIDTGTSTHAPLTDLDHNPRPAGSRFDMGAYEYWKSSTNFLNLLLFHNQVYL